MLAVKPNGEGRIPKKDVTGPTIIIPYKNGSYVLLSLPGGDIYMYKRNLHGDHIYVLPAGEYSKIKRLGRYRYALPPLEFNHGLLQNAYTHIKAQVDDSLELPAYLMDPQKHIDNCVGIWQKEVPLSEYALFAGKGKYHTLYIDRQNTFLGNPGFFCISMGSKILNKKSCSSKGNIQILLDKDVNYMLPVGKYAVYDSGARYILSNESRTYVVSIPKTRAPKPKIKLPDKSEMGYLILAQAYSGIKLSVISSSLYSSVYITDGKVIIQAGKRTYTTAIVSIRGQFPKHFYLPTVMLSLLSGGYYKFSLNTHPATMIRYERLKKAWYGTIIKEDA